METRIPSPLVPSTSLSNPNESRTPPSSNVPLTPHHTPSISASPSPSVSTPNSFCSYLEIGYFGRPSRCVTKRHRARARPSIGTGVIVQEELTFVSRGSAAGVLSVRYPQNENRRLCGCTLTWENDLGVRKQGKDWICGIWGTGASCGSPRNDSGGSYKIPFQERLSQETHFPCSLWKKNPPNSPMTSNLMTQEGVL